MEQHNKEFQEYTPEKLMELVEASTQVGKPLGQQGSGSRFRPILGLFFYDQPLAVAVQVGSNGFVVSMNKKSLDDVVKKNPQHGELDAVKQLLQDSHSWPKV